MKGRCLIAWFLLATVGCGQEPQEEKEAVPNPLPRCNCPPWLEPDPASGAYQAMGASGLMKFGDFPVQWLSLDTLEAGTSEVKVVFWNEAGEKLTAVYKIKD